MNNKYGLTYPSQNDFYDIDVINSNFSKLADGIDVAKSGGLKGQVIVAAYNSKNPLKAYADFVCTQASCHTVLKNAIEKANEGGEVMLLDGDYYMSSYVYIQKAITLSGMGGKFTRIKLIENVSAVQFLRMSVENITIRDIGFYSNDSFLDVTAIEMMSKNSVVDNCYFEMGTSAYEDGISNIFIGNFSGYARVSNCIFKKHDDHRYNIRANEGVWKGVMYGNYCMNAEDESPMALKVNLSGYDSYNSIGIGAQKTAVYINGVLKA